MRAKVTIKDQEVLAAFRALSSVTKAANLETALRAGGLPIINKAAELSPKLTGTNARSIHQEPTDQGEGYLMTGIGPSTDYGRRLEEGFSDTDALGRTYNQPPRPYMRPAFDAERGNAIEETGDVLRQLVLGVSI